MTRRALDDPLCGILATETEGQTESQCATGEDSRQDHLDQSRSDAEGDESCEDCEYPDRPLGDAAEELGWLHVSGPGACNDCLLKGVSDDDRDHQDKDCYDNLWDVVNYLSQERVDLI